MNKPRRKKLELAIDLLQQAMEIVSDVEEEEQEAFDNMPESLQYSERGEKMEEYIDELGDCETDVQDIIDRIFGIVEG